MKKAQYVQLQKYTKSNMDYYKLYLQQIIDIPWKYLKFADESHFVSKGMKNNSKLIIKNVEEKGIMAPSESGNGS